MLKMLKNLKNDRKGFLPLLLGAPWILLGGAIFILLLLLTLKFTLPYFVGGLLIIGALILAIILANAGALTYQMLILIIILVVLGILSLAFPEMWSTFQNLTIVEALG